MSRSGRGWRGVGRWLLRSLAGRLVLVSIVFLAVPLLIYEQFRNADEEKQLLLLRSAQQQGQLIARAVEPLLAGLDGPALAGLGKTLTRFADENTRVRVLLRPNVPAGGSGKGFYYVASAPAVPTAMLDLERERLIEQGVLVRLAASCAGDQALAIPVPTEKGGVDLLTSITPIKTGMGCWAVVTSHAAAAYLGVGMGQPYWRTPEVQAAALVYIAMAALVLVLLLEVWRNLRRFGELARDIVMHRGPASSFSEQNTVPELEPVAEDFDRLVATLHNSAVNLRRAAEDNAHAFKTPIAVIRQAVEPLKRIVPPEDSRGRRAIDMIEGSIERLDGLVSFARRMDETAADLLETVIENVVDNALSFSPAGGSIRVVCKREGAGILLAVDDEGPGVDPANVEKIFERYFSQRPASHAAGRPPARAVAAGRFASDGDGPADDMPHYGIGLWIVRRNVEAVGGRVDAENRLEGGLGIRIRLPAA